MVENLIRYRLIEDAAEGAFLWKMTRMHSKAFSVVGGERQFKCGRAQLS
jgi:hypothetical protein